ncbi:unnamed protein product [Orchesella dallaii]|uniref:Retinol dehydrogenase 11 n=1 Tax=Orchesella dallaii TaxID=48710 RepID=A0ABP1R7D2_9HEXA
MGNQLSFYLQAVGLVIRHPLLVIDVFTDSIRFNRFDEGDMEEEPVNGKIAIVTGSNCGIGKQLAKDLAKRGATVILACRNLMAGRCAMEDIKTENSDANMEVIALDLGNLSSVLKFASEVKSRYPKIHLLINNAGVCSFKDELQKTVDGFELHMGVNHLGHFLLTNLLLENLKAGAPSRIVNLSSSSMLFSELNLDDLMMEKFKKPTRLIGISRLPYNNSKMAIALFTKELARRLKATRVNAYAVCPGIAKTGVFRDVNKMESFLAYVCLAMIGFSIPKVILTNINQ